MRLPRRIDKILITATILSVFTVSACLTHFLIRQKTYADSDPLAQTASVSENADAENAETSENSAKNDHFVVFYDAGEKLIVKTSAATVSEALSRAGFSLNSADSVEPSLETAIDSDNFHINIYRSHPVLLIDGAKKLYFETASYEPKTIFTEAGFTVYDGDEIKTVQNDDFLETGVATAYELYRNGGQTITIEEEISFSEKTIIDYSLPVGTSKIEQLGEVGRKTLVYEVFYVDNAEISRNLISETINSEPVEKITIVGGRLSSATSASENEQITWNFLKGQGFSDVQTAGIMGNLTQEHHFETSDSAGGLGIAQWTGGRRQNLLSRSDPYNIYTQLEYLMEELNGGYAKVQAALREATTIEDATRIFQNQFERCGICREENRIGFAYDIYERYAK